MEKTQYSQLELFCEHGNRAAEKLPLQASLLHFIKAYEKVILALIGLLVVTIATFSLGVEKGKRLSQGAGTAEVIRREPPALPKGASQPVGATLPKGASQPVGATLPAAVPEVKKIVPLLPPEITQTENSQVASSGFTIQVASFQAKGNALREAQVLKKNGFSPILTTKGKYAVLCVGNFSDKKSAQLMLSKFKKQYQGCFIRRL